MQNFEDNSTSFTFSPQLDTTLNVSDARDIPVAFDNNMSQASTMIPIITPLTTPPNENQAHNLQAVAPNNALLPMQYYQQVPNPSSLANSQEIVNEHSFFYTPSNDHQLYHIICKEISASQLISNTESNLMNDYDQPNNIFVFYHEPPEIKKIFQLTCEMVSHTFLFQFLNRTNYNIQFFKYEHQQEFSRRHQEYLKVHLKNDLIHFLKPKIIYEHNYNEQKRFIQDYHTYESMINSNTYVPNNHSHQQYYTNTPLPFSQQNDNNFQIVSSQNNGNQDNFNLRSY
ncbi:hypothetical protein RhiirA4_470917 [Rhizophagus irregularis]|uniref:Uncharacterized protein n=1 Tax=Rhizophagus irregularis TaxID=588596 RepID=A0A2I1H2C4_9GLOM|nr:hypothetical protein RhiirA4_470917 [Rhizophagus irregularis]